jgi:hypothetical protein
LSAQDAQCIPEIFSSAFLFSSGMILLSSMFEVKIPAVSLPVFVKKPLVWSGSWL